MVPLPANGPTPVRILKKVRRQFLHKTPIENEPQNQNPNPNPASDTEVHPLRASFGIVEVGRKLCIGPQFLNRLFQIESTTIDRISQFRSVTLNLCPHKNVDPVPWEQTVNRLESYGDLEMSTWVHRIRTFFINYEKAMTSFYEMLNSSDQSVHDNLRRTQAKARSLCREIEHSYPFNKYTQYLRVNSNELISCSFSEDFLAEIGHTPESFVNWTKINGIPRTLDTNSEVYQVIMKGALEYVPMIADPIQEGKEMESIIYDKEGRQKKIKVKFMAILEPTQEAAYYHWYLIVCEKGTEIVDAIENAKENPLKKIIEKTN